MSSTTWKASTAPSARTSTAIIKSGGTYDDVRAKAANYREELGNQFDQLGITKDEQQAYLTQLGLTPDQIETTIKLSEQAEAMQQLGLLQGEIEKLPPEVQTKYNALVADKDYIGARDLLTGLQYDPKTGTWREATITTKAETSGAEVTLQKVTDGTYEAEVDINGNHVPFTATVDDLEKGDYDTTLVLNGENTPAHVSIKQMEDGSWHATVLVGADTSLAAKTIKDLDGHRINVYVTPVLQPCQVVAAARSSWPVARSTSRVSTAWARRVERRCTCLRARRWRRRARRWWPRAGLSRRSSTTTSPSTLPPWPTWPRSATTPSPRSRRPRNGPGPAGGQRHERDRCP